MSMELFLASSTFEFNSPQLFCFDNIKLNLSVRSMTILTHARHVTR